MQLIPSRDTKNIDFMWVDKPIGSVSYQLLVKFTMNIDWVATKVNTYLLQCRFDLIICFIFEPIYSHVTVEFFHEEEEIFEYHMKQGFFIADFHVYMEEVTSISEIISVSVIIQERKPITLYISKITILQIRIW